MAANSAGVQSLTSPSAPATKCERASVARSEAINGCAAISASGVSALTGTGSVPMVAGPTMIGIASGTEQEFGGIIRHGAKMLYAYSEATVPLITVVVRKAYGGAYLGMCSKALGADMVLAWPQAEIAVMGAEGAANIVFRKEIEGAEDSTAMRSKKIEDYRDAFANPYVAAERGLVDRVILPETTREEIWQALVGNETKRSLRPRRKHGVLPH